MRPFTEHRGIVAAMDRADVDTDQIIPKQFLKRIERTGFEDYLFFDWRFLDDGSPNPDFELNQPRPRSLHPARSTQFRLRLEPRTCRLGAGQLRFSSVIAPSFADIFFNNCFKNGVLPIALGEEQVEQLFQNVRQSGDTPYELTVDLRQQTIRDDAGLSISFTVDADRRANLLQGLDDIARTLEMEDAIRRYEQEHESRLARGRAG
jgi:3-isopropylmalate/(R)-2-methylmalate dehydratase small subunit